MANQTQSILAQRKLSAILAADVVGYTRLMHDDEDATHATNQAFLNEVFEPRIAAHGGRIFKRMGDGILAEFPSAVEAVKSAIALQQTLTERNTDLPENRRLLFRIGVNVGDVIVDDDDIFGDGVNIAARLEGLARPGGICVSGSVHEQVSNRIDVVFADRGARRVKNIAHPIHVFDVVTTVAVAVSSLRKKPIVTFVALLVVALALVSMMEIWWPSQSTTPPKAEAKPAPPLPSKPSIAILAFDNLSGEAKEEYFANGIAEDITTDLSRVSGLFVIARNSSFFYKGKKKKIRDIGRELGVKYVLEGSIRRHDGEIRLNVQLIDAATGGHVWAKRYTRKVGEIFVLQDDITRNVVAAVTSKLIASNIEPAAGRPENIAAYEAILLGRPMLRQTTPEGTAMAIKHFQKALEIDQNYEQAHAAMAAAYLQIRRFQWQGHQALAFIRFDHRDDPESRAAEHLEKIFDPEAVPSSLAFRTRAELKFRWRFYEGAMADLTRAEQLDPNDPDNLALRGQILIASGRAAEAFEPLRRARRLDPNFPSVYLAWEGIAEFALGNYRKAAELLERSFERNATDHLHLAHLVAAYGHLGRKNEAANILAIMNGLRAQADLDEPYTRFDASQSVYYGLGKQTNCGRFRFIKGLEQADVPLGSEIEPPIDVTACN
jgi:TolB-like protein/class 3 adenylate cyclase/Flp pilus assembly protein TadD